MNIEKTPLESAILQQIFEANASIGFPAPCDIEVVGRKNSGAGRFVALKSSVKLADISQYLDMSGRYIEMCGVEFGLSAAVAIERGEIVEMELAVNGNAEWDGEEREWQIV